MSSLYNLEPNPTAKVILKTTAGDILIELFAKQTPLTSRNFLQLCLDGYYDNTIFHRLVPDFIVQGGDPTGTGSGGQSSYDGGAPFADEFHSRLRFNRRGLLGMANSGTKNDNGSQFFFTLGKAEELNSRNTMFGRIEGDTIYNLVGMAESELMEGEHSDRPMYPTRVTGAEVLVNPFDDMVKRTQVAQSQMSKKSDVKKKPRKKAGKQMLSFGADEEDEGDTSGLIKVPKFNPRLVQAGDLPLQPKSVPHANPKAKPPQPRRVSSDRDVEILPAPRPAAMPIAEVNPVPEPSSDSDSESQLDEQAERLAKTNAHIAELKQSLKRDVPTPTQHDTKRQKMGLEAMVPSGAKRGVKKIKAGSKEEQQQLSAFTAFKSRLGAGGSGPNNTSRNSTAKHLDGNADGSKSNTTSVEEEDVCDLHFVPNCQSCKRWEEAEEENNDEGLTSEGLMGHSLSFAKDRLGKSLEWKRQTEKELVVIDPREREKEILGSKKSKSRTNN